ncbi:MAG: response regulator [Bacteroidales bacterium]|nr:response regulator [Bacteroidales bacterium]
MGHKVLVVDDTSINRELILNILKNTNGEYEVLEAANGLEGYNIALEQLPDIVLMDIRMPEVDGIEGIKLLKSNDLTKEIPVLVLTAYSSPENLKECFEVGAFDYITKPINSEELVSRIKKALGVNLQIRTIQDRIAEFEDKKSEFENLAIISGNRQNSFILIKTDGELEWASEGFEGLHGMPLEEYKQKMGSTIFSLCQDPEIIAQFNKCVAKKIPIEFSSKIIKKGGEEQWIQTFISPKLNENQEVERLIATEVDISSVKKKEEELNKQNQRMQAIMQNLEKANQQLAIQRDEINHQKQLIQEEQNKSEKLLLNILPFEIAKQLKSKGKATSRQYKVVSVLFADFKGFSKFSMELEPNDLVNILDTYFAKFDEIIGKHYLEKIKTIGDAYMCAGGLPLRNKSNPFDAVLTGLEIQNYMNRLNDSKVVNNLSVWELRVGIHTGPVVAGVVGRKKFAYDIWGETVNIASRMEQSGHVGMVNVSGDTYEYIKDFFLCDYRGKIEAKNIGKVDMYFVNRLKPEFSMDDDGIVPNEHFINLVNRL